LAPDFTFHLIQLVGLEFETILEALAIRFVSVLEGLREVIVETREESSLRELLRAAIQAASLEEFPRSL
jgi:hypothetical protein